MPKVKKYTHHIKNWPEEDRPREKLIKNGEHTLSNSELLAILLRNGVKGESAIDLSRKILDKFKSFRSMSHTDLSNWYAFKGLGTAKIAQIKAAIEIGRRFGEEEIKEEKTTIESSRDVAKMLMPRMRDLKKEIFKTILLNSSNQLIDILEIVKGSVSQANPIIREIFHQSLRKFVSSIICVHNHPSGNPNPSSIDKQFTLKLKQTGEVLDIKVIDHVIIGNNDYFSFADEGLL
ncbi:MAG: DNA repair protein RadC [Candidatus Caldatribacteriota bacterium]|nr:DNA repair protein RadC [Candidatus Caldatribacteriota bacterium]